MLFSRNICQPDTATAGNVAVAAYKGVINKVFVIAGATDSAIGRGHGCEQHNWEDMSGQTRWQRANTHLWRLKAMPEHAELANASSYYIKTYLNIYFIMSKLFTLGYIKTAESVIYALNGWIC